MPVSSVTWGDIFTEDMILYYQKHPVEFVKEVILADCPDVEIQPEQVEMIEHICKYKRVTVRSGRGIGKSGLISWAIIWWLVCFPESKIICTAPSRSQMDSALWPEVAMWLGRSSALSSIITHTATKLYMNGWQAYWFCQPRTVSKDSQVSMSGLHAEHMLLICDEAGGTDDAVIEEFLNTMTKPHNHIVMIGNPIKTSGIFYESHTKDGRWRRLHYNAEKSALTDKETHDYIAAKYGRNSDKYRIDVLGEFPRGTPDSMIALEKVKAAMMRDVEPSGDISIGVDVARFGDDNTVICWRQGYKVFPLITIENADGGVVAGRVLKLVDDIRNGRVEWTDNKGNTREETRTKGYNKTIKVYVDATGVGSSPIDFLNLDRTHNIEPIDVNFGSASDDPQYERYATVMWAHVRDVIDLISLPEDGFLEDELSSRRYSVNHRGRVMIEPKSDFKKRFGNSPDRADALVLAFAQKQSDKMVLPDFDPLDSRFVGTNAGYIANADQYCSIFYAKDMSVSVIYAVWTGSKLVIVDEYNGDGSIPIVSYNIQEHGKRRTIGSQNMFNKTADDMSSQFRKYGISVMENYRYDEFGAIQALQKLVSQKRIFILDNCLNTVNQMRQWRLEGVSQKDLYTNYGICYAICNIISELKNHHKLEPQAPKVFIPYSGEKQDYLRNFGKPMVAGKNAWQSL